MSEREEVVWFPSKVDGWLAGVLALAPLVSFAAWITTWVAGKDFWVGFSACALVLAIYGGLIFPMRYGIGGIVRHGLVRQRCKLAEILTVTPSRNPISSPALSLDRLEVSKGERFRDSILISPADREGFLALMAREAGLERDGERLFRAGG